MLHRDILGDGQPWRIVLDPDIIEMNWERVQAGSCTLSVNHDDAPLPEAPAQQVREPVGVVLGVDHEPGEFRAEVAFGRSDRAGGIYGLVEDGILAGVSPRLGLDEIQVIDAERRLGVLRKATLVNLSLVQSPDDPDLIVLRGGETTMMVDSAGRSAAIGTDVDTKKDKDVDKDDAHMMGGEGKEGGDAPPGETDHDVPDDVHLGDGYDKDDDKDDDKDGGDKRMGRDGGADNRDIRMTGAVEGVGDMPDDDKDKNGEGQNSPSGGGDSAESERRMALMTLGLEHNVHPQVVMQAVKDNLSREQLVDKLLSEKYGSVQYAPMLGASRDKRPVQMGRLVAHMMAPQDKAVMELAAVEIAMMSEHEHADIDYSPFPPGALVGVGQNTPVFAMPTRESWMRMMAERGDVRMAQDSTGVAAAIGTAIGWDMAEPYPMDYAVEPILRRAYVREGLSANVMYPVTTGGLVLAFAAEAGAAADVDSDVIAKNLAPKELSTEVKISRQSLVRTDQWAYENEMRTLGVRRREEVVKSILGVNTGANAPTGIKDLTAHATTVDRIRTGKAWTDTAGEELSYGHITDLAAKVSKSKAPWDDRVYLCDVDAMALMAATPRFTNASYGIVEVMRMEGGGLETVAYTAPMIESTLMDANTIYYGHFAAVNVGFFGAPLVWLDTISVTSQVVLRHFELYDVSISRADYFAKLIKA